MSGLVAAGLAVGIDPLGSQPAVYDMASPWRFRKAEKDALYSSYPMGILRLGGFWTRQQKRLVGPNGRVLP